MNNIYDALNRQYSLDDFVCIGNIISENQRKKLEKEGYNVGYTRETWEKQYPRLPAKHIICPKTILFPASLYYLDEEQSICFPLNVFGTSVMGNRENFEENALTFIRELKNNLKNKDYIRLLSPTSSEGSGNITMRLMRNLLKREEANEKLYKAFIDMYTFSDCGALQIGGDTTMETLLRCKSDAQKRATQAALSKFPDIIEVYRGEGSKSTPCGEGYSWTTNENKAYFFASWRGGEMARIIKGLVRKENVIEYINDRNESEIIALPKDVEVTDVTECTSLDEFVNTLSADYQDEGYENFEFGPFFNGGEVAELTQSTFNAMLPPNVADHDLKHSAHVALMAMFLFRKTVMGKYKNATPLEKEFLFSACDDLLQSCIWHDMGRVDSSVSTSHGKESYRMFSEEEGDNEIVKLLTVYHCRKDAEAKAAWRRMKFRNDIERDLAWNIFCILKDADALDRWRFGSTSDDFVDVAQLRLPESKLLMPVAAVLQHVKIGGL